MRRSSFLLVLTLTACSDASMHQIKPFKPDGCTLFPEGNWHACCVTHDRAYWCGGTAAQRQDADAALRQCIAARGHPNLSKLVYFGVRLGGVSALPTPWRWGFGWPYGTDFGDSAPTCDEAH